MPPKAAKQQVEQPVEPPPPPPQPVIEQPSFQLERLDANGDGVIYYPSQNLAVAICKGLAGQSITVYEDKAQNQRVLVAFETNGVGSVSYKNGKPWLVVTREGWTVSDPAGNIMERGKFPRQQTQAVTCDVNRAVRVVFANRQDIVLSFKVEGLAKEWQCGEQLKRTESHLDKVVGSKGGKLELDVARIRDRQANTGSLYVPKGPHAHPTEHSGLGSLKTKLRTLRSDSPLGGAIRDLQASDARLGLIDTLPKAIYGTARTGSAGASPGSLGGTAGSLVGGGTQTASSAAGGQGGQGADGADAGGTPTRNRSSPLLPSFGSPELTDSQRRLQRKLASQGARAAAVAHEPRRAKLQPLGAADAEARLFGKDCVKDTLYMLCILADWNPVSLRLEAKLEAGHGTLVQEAARDPGGPAGHVQVYRVDGSGPLVKGWMKRWGFRSVPMFLAFYDRHLVFASNNITSAEELVTACKSSLEKGQKAMFLPDLFTFGGRDNQILDSIHPDMKLLG